MKLSKGVVFSDKLQMLIDLADKDPLVNKISCHIWTTMLSLSHIRNHHHYTVYVKVLSEKSLTLFHNTMDIVA